MSAKMWWKQVGKEPECRDLCVPVLIRMGEVGWLRAAPEKKISEILEGMALPPTYGFYSVIDVVGRAIVDGGEAIGGIKDINYAAQNPDECNFWLVDLSMEVTVCFNTVFRMVTGTPSHLQYLYIQPGMTVAEFTTILKRDLMIDKADRRFGLYGHAQNELMRLENNMLMTELKEREDLDNPSFFQFQMHPEFESQANLGISRASNLTMYAKRGVRKQKKCWFSLQGTSLFYRPSLKDNSDVRELKRVDLCKIVYRGGNKKDTLFRFDMIPPKGQGPVRVFTSPVKRRIVRWVKELRCCHPTIQLSDPVTFKDIQQIRNTRHDKFSTVTRLKNEQIKELGYNQRKAIEIAEARLQGVEIDGGILLLNGYSDEPGVEMGKRWLENIRRLLLFCCHLEPTHTAEDLVNQIHRTLKLIRPWVTYFEESPNSHILAPEPVGIRALVDECSFLVNLYRVYAVKMNGLLDDDSVTDATRAHILVKMLDNLEEALGVSIFEYRPVRRYLVRGAKEREKPPSPTAEVSRRRVRQNPDTMEPTNNGYIQSLLATAPLDQYPVAPKALSSSAHSIALNTDTVASLKSEKQGSYGFFGYLFGKVASLLRRNKMIHGFGNDGSDERDSYTLSLQNGEHLEDQKWAEDFQMCQQDLNQAHEDLNTARGISKNTDVEECLEDTNQRENDELHKLEESASKSMHEGSKRTHHNSDLEPQDHHQEDNEPITNQMATAELVKEKLQKATEVSKIPVIEPDREGRSILTQPRVQPNFVVPPNSWARRGKRQISPLS